jgi:hypothetical protein
LRHPVGVVDRRIANSERRLQQELEQEPREREERGIFVLFDLDEDAPLARDTDVEEEPQS